VDFYAWGTIERGLEVHLYMKNQPPMIVTKELLKEQFAAYNTLYFDGKLGKCGFSFFSKNITFLGWYCAKEDSRGRPNDKIWIGTCVKWTEEGLKRVLIHEMIHMYVHRIEGHRYDGIFGHGRRFRREARRIRKEYGIETLKCPDVEFLDKNHRPQWWEKALLWLIDR
jgi:hypothetical protein